MVLFNREYEEYSEEIKSKEEILTFFAVTRDVEMQTTQLLLGYLALDVPSGSSPFPGCGGKALQPFSKRGGALPSLVPNVQLLLRDPQSPQVTQ